MEIVREPVRDATAWRGADFAGDDSWEIHLTDAQRAEFGRNLEAVKSRGLSIAEVGAADFPLDALKPAAAEVVHQLKDGRGFTLMRGFPVEAEGYSVDDIRMMYWGFGQHLGICVSQDRNAALVADVMDRGQVRKTPMTRAYGSKRRTNLHIDLADCVALLCIRNARSGGVSSLSSSMTVYNAILEQHPEWLERLYRGFHWDRFNEHSPWDEPTSTSAVPMFSAAGGKVSCRYNRNWITGASVRREQPFTEEEVAMFDFFDAVAKENELQLAIGPGDVQFASNYTVLHGRGEYEEDTSIPETQKRHLLRLWFNIPGIRPIAGEAVRYGLISHGHIGWLPAELLDGAHTRPDGRRSFGEKAAVPA